MTKITKYKNLALLLTTVFLATSCDQGSVSVLDKILSDSLVTNTTSNTNTSIKGSDIFNNINPDGIKVTPECNPTFKISQETFISMIETVHDKEKYSKKESTIFFKSSDGKIYGPWVVKKAIEINAYYRVYPNISIPSGEYTIYDSDTLSQYYNTTSKGCGFVRVVGYNINNISNLINNNVATSTNTELTDVVVNDTQTALNYINEYASIQENAYFELLGMFSENGEKPLFDLSIELTKNNYSRIYELQQQIVENQPKYQAALTYLDSISISTKQLRIKGLLSSVGNFFRWAYDSKKYARDNIISIQSKLSTEDKQECYTIAKDRFGVNVVGSSVEEYEKKLANGLLDNQANQLHKNLSDESVGYFDTASGLNKTPSKVAVKQASEGIKVGVDVISNTTNLIAPDFGKGYTLGKKIVENINDPKKLIENNVKDYVKSKVKGLDLGDAAGFIGKEAADFIATEKTKNNLKTSDDSLKEGNGKITVVMGDSPKGTIPENVGGIIIKNKTTGKVTISTKEPIVVLTPDTYDILTIAKDKNKLSTNENIRINSGEENIISSTLFPKSEIPVEPIIPPTQSVITTKYQEGWCTIPVTIEGAKFIKDEWSEGWRVNGESWSAEAVSPTINIKGSIICTKVWSYFDYNYSIEITANGASNKTLFSEASTLSLEGGTKSFQATLDSNNTGFSNGSIKVYAKILGGNPDFSTRYTSGTITLPSKVWKK
ncbi:MAG: hypothetical protein U0457_09190 [Candidatus Sericytochromatia bacterium]